MRPFLINLASDSDLWMFVTSVGGLTAGRVDAEGSLFPYETVDRLYDAGAHTGPVTLIRWTRGTGHEQSWEPLSARSPETSGIERNLYKNPLGNRLVFEELHHSAGLAFRYRWAAADPLGWVRTATLSNLGHGPVRISLLDGLRNVLPFGVPLAVYQQASCLADAYKRSELDSLSRLAIFSLTSRIIDRPEAAEVLRANTVWCHGLPDFEVSLSPDAVDAFRAGEPLPLGHTLTGRRGNYLASSAFTLQAGARAKWQMVADSGRSQGDAASLRARLLEAHDLDGQIEDSLAGASGNLLRNVASADGLQLSGDAEADAHHLANVLFNNMRGGVFDRNYDLPVRDFADFLNTRNREVAARHRARIQALPERVPAAKLHEVAAATGDADLERLCHEYLPLYFGRRHGDPSRPWNKFAIRLRNPDGSRSLSYEGNWRDVFQNWEALSLSFPGFLPNIIAKFVNASTVDGFNPYRITRDATEWEVPEEGDPWSNIGYWGDHQIIYLLKFLESLRDHDPRALAGLLDRRIFSYADVPYRLKPYREMLADPHSTIHYDRNLESRIAERVAALGTDGKLVPARGGSVHHANLLEKLLVPALSKLSNLVPDGGIWMNTQRPEWNDANNALVGHGISMVTLCHLRRYLAFLAGILGEKEGGPVPVSVEVVRWARQVREILERSRPLLASAGLGDGDRRMVLDELGEAYSAYRAQVYRSGFSGSEDMPAGEITSLCAVALEHLDHAMRANRREDGLYDSYNLLDVSGEPGTAAVRPLYEMLEGQVAALGSGLVPATEAVRLLDALFESRMYRADQRSFLLYPERTLPGFLDKNVIPADRVQAVPLLRDLLQAGEKSILEHDAAGHFRFHADFGNSGDLERALDRLAAGPHASRAGRDRGAVLELFEDVFRHREFTGRSGAMYGYEGLGCIYWHMVTKLLLAVQETALRAIREDGPEPVSRALVAHYYRIRAGLGFEKSPAEYGAFPCDPYSHTPAQGGAQQPGMTGQVKEEILARFGELGAGLKDGIVRFRPEILRRNEFRRSVGAYRHFDVHGAPGNLEVPAGGLAFSYCQVPVLYEISPGNAWIRVVTAGGEPTRREGDALDPDQSRSLLGRTGAIARIEVGIPAASLSRFESRS